MLFIALPVQIFIVVG